MISKPIFKQTLMANYKLWIIFTVILCFFSSLVIITYDPSMMSSMMNMMEEAVADMGIQDMVGDQMNSLTTLVGMLSNSFYGMMAVVLSLIYVIITANSLIASQVDRGSMAYLLSTPTKRSTVVRTQGLYLITAIFGIFFTITIVGLVSAQISQGGVFTTAYTDDVKAISKLLDKNKKDVAEDLLIILDNEKAIIEGADAKEIDVDVYTLYINMKIEENSYKTAAKVLDMDVKKVKEDLTVILSNDKALEAGAEVMGMDAASYYDYIDNAITAKAMQAEQASELQKKVIDGLSAAAVILNTDVTSLSSDMGRIKENEAALSAASSAAGMPAEYFIIIINNQLASEQLTLDEGAEFDVKDFLMLNLGCFLLMFAISSISFFASCMFNLSKNSLALGAGLPLAFYLFQVMSQIGDNLEWFKYLSLNSLYDTNAIINRNNYVVQFAVLAVVGLLLYTAAMKIFKEKDLPL